MMLITTSSSTSENPVRGDVCRPARVRPVAILISHLASVLACQPTARRTQQATTKFCCGEHPPVKAAANSR
jgi:hypothetical protein